MDGSNHLSRSRALTEHPTRNHNHEWQPYYASQTNSMPQYHSPAGMAYMGSGNQLPYSPVSSGYHNFSPTYSQYPNTSQAAIHWPTAAPPVQFNVRPPPRNATLPSQHRVIQRGNGYPSASQTQRHSHFALRQSMPLDFLMETEEQDSVNRDTMLSEVIEPAIAGYPKVEEFDELMKRYVSQLSPKKQDKALIHATRAHNIRTVLIDKKTTSVESAQFRFWVKKMFQLQPIDASIPVAQKKICHEGKPVAIREKLFKILTRAHQKCQHGGRDKTSAQVRKVYSWVPKELISRFVKLCPTCQIRRGMNRNSPEKDESPSPPEEDDTEMADELESPIKSRRASTIHSSCSSVLDLPVQLANSTTTFQSQNRWMSDYTKQHATYSGIFSPIDELNSYDPSTSSSQAMSNISPTHSRPSSKHQQQYKGARYYD